MNRYVARSASDGDPDWPVWIVIDATTGVNCVAELCDAMSIERQPGATLCTRAVAEALALLANEKPDA